MDDKEIKKLFESILSELGFKKTRYVYVRDFDYFLLRMSLQHYFGSVEYHLDCYFLFKDIHEPEKLKAFLMADVSNRLLFNLDGEYEEYVKIGELEPDRARTVITVTVSEFISLLEKEGIKGYFKSYPEALNTVMSGARSYLEKEGYIDKE